MRLAVAATPEVAIPTLEWLLASNHEVQFVITRADSASGRGKTLKETSVAQWGKRNGIPIMKPLNVSELISPLADVDLLLTIAFGKILPFGVLSSPKYGSINMHFSLLPRWRGAAPVQRSLQSGDRYGGISIFALDEGMDTGPIFLREKYEYPDNASAGTVLTQLSLLGPHCVERTLAMVEAGVQPFTQESVGVSYAPKVTKMDAHIDWSSDSEMVLRGIRAFTPEPGAWSIWRGTPIQISKARAAVEKFFLQPGELAIEDGKVFVGCGSASMIEIEEVIPSGKNLMKATSWRNGARIQPGDLLGK